MFFSSSFCTGGLLEVQFAYFRDRLDDVLNFYNLTHSIVYSSQTENFNFHINSSCQTQVIDLFRQKNYFGGS